MSCVWAYEFRSNKSLVDLLALFNAGGPWTWQIRDSDWWGDYMQSRPSSAVRIRIHDPAANIGRAGHSWTPHEPGEWVEYNVQLEIESDSIERSALDEIFLGLLRRAGVRDLREIESYA